MEQAQQTAPHDAPVLDRDSLLRAAPVLARLAASAWWRATGWTVTASVRVSVRMLRAAAAGEPPAVLMREAESELRDYLRRLLGVDENGRGPAPEPRGDARAADVRGREAGTDTPLTVDALRERGAALLR